MAPDSIRAAAFLDKGGTGKTTTVAHIGVALANQGMKVLLIDLAGKQSDLSKNFGLWSEYRERIENEDDWPNISTAMREQWSRIADRLGDEAVTEMILETDDGPDLIPAHPGLDGLETELNEVEDSEKRYSRLRYFIDDYVEGLGYDAILLDLPGSTNNISYNGVWAAGNVIAPVEAGPFESRQAERLIEDIDRINRRFDVDIDLEMLVLNKVDNRTRLSDEFMAEYREKYGDVLASMPIPRCQDIRNAATEGKTLFSYNSGSSTARDARNAFERNTEEFMEKLG